MDAFFAAIEQRDNPSYRNKPVVVGADPKGGCGRGVVSTCSYEARKFGIHSAMPISSAYRLCPKAVFIPPSMDKYCRVSHEIYTILNDFSPIVEPAGIDEAFLDITGSFHLFDTPLETCELIKSKILKQTKLTCSVGLAPTKMAAKIASDLEKPDGLVIVAKEGLNDFLNPLDIGKLWGLGKRTKAILNTRGIHTVGGLARRNPVELTALLGKNGQHLWQLAQGIDNSPVCNSEEVKSLSNEHTFSEDTRDYNEINGVLISLCEKVSCRLRNEAVKGRTITLKIRLEGFMTYSRAMTLSKATNYADVLYRAVDKLYNNFDKKKRKIRLLGVKVSGLLPSLQRDSIFDKSPDVKREKVHSAVDKIRGKFGDNAIKRAGMI
ncbi:MAG: DNA polymerase IV [Candidatus Omnitrophota bacterium]